MSTTSTLAPVNQTYFQPYNFNITDGRKAYVDPNGTFRTAFDEVADSTHTKVAQDWRMQCIPAEELFNRITEASKFNVDVRTAESNVRLSDSLTLPDGTTFTLSGLRSLMLFAGIPIKMQDWLVMFEYRNDLSRFCNEALDRREIEWADKGRDARDFMVRMRKDENGKNIVRAVLSSKYARFDNHQACAVVSEALGNLDDVLVSHGWTNQDSMMLDLILPDDRKDDPTNQWGVGFSFSNNEIGSGSFTLEPYVFRSMSRAGYRWGGFSTIVSVDQRHSGTIDYSRLATDVKRAINVALTEGRCMLNLLSLAQTVRISDPALVIAGLMTEAKLTRQDVEQVAHQFLAGQSDPLTADTAFGVVESIAITASKSNGERRTILESAAGKLVAPKLTSGVAEMGTHWLNIEQTAGRKADKDTVLTVRQILAGTK